MGNISTEYKQKENVFFFLFCWMKALSDMFFDYVNFKTVCVEFKVNFISYVMYNYESKHNL